MVSRPASTQHMCVRYLTEGIYTNVEVQRIMELRKISETEISAKIEVKPRCQ